MIKWRTGGSRWTPKAVITPVEVERETESSVWVKGRRCAKVTESEIYHDTWDAAHAYLLEVAEAKVLSAQMDLERKKGHLGNVKGMKKPD